MIKREDLEARFGAVEIAERGDAAQINQAIADAIDEARSYLRAAHLENVPPSEVLKGFVCDIARYRLYDDGNNEIIETRYKQAIAWLERVVKNPSMLGVWPDSGAYAVRANAPPKWSDWSE